MKRNILKTLIVAVAAYALVGCGGVGSSYRGTTPFTGSYIGTWSAGTADEFGVLTISVADNAEIAGTIKNIATGENGILSGEVEPSGKFDGSIVYQNGTTVNIATGVMGGGSASTGISGDATYTRSGSSMAFQFSADATSNPIFNGTFGGTYDIPGLGVSGAVTFTSNADGSLAGTYIEDITGEIGRIEGAIDVVGNFKFVFIKQDGSRLKSVCNTLLWIDKEQVWHLDGDGKYIAKNGAEFGITFNTSGAAVPN